MAGKTPADAAQPNPYPGSRPYRTEEWSRFFGRDDEARTAAAFWLDKRLTVVSGEPGIGKTSLLTAGIVRLVQSPHADVLPIGSLSCASPFSAAPLFDANPFTLALLSSWAPLEAPAALSTMTIAGFLQGRRQAMGMTLTLAAVDQAEELFRKRAAMRRHRDQFIDDLTQALHDEQGLHVLLIVRDGQLADVEGDDRFGTDAQVQIDGLDRAAAIDAARGPLARTGRSFAPGAAEELVGSLVPRRAARSAAEDIADRQSLVNPAHLQAILSRLWDTLPAETAAISGADLARFVDVDGWLGDLICGTVSSVARYHELDAVQLVRWLAQTFVTAAGAAAAAAEEHGATAGMPSQVLADLEDHALLRSIVRSGSRWFELRSDRLTGPVLRAAATIAEFARAGGAPGPAEWLADAGAAFSRGDFELADRHSQRALHASPQSDSRSLAAGETLRGNIAYQLGSPGQAREHYMNAAKLLEVTQSQLAVGRLLAAIGHLHLTEQDATTAVATLRSAVSRVPADRGVKMDLARAFAASGEAHAAAAMLDAVLASADARDAGEAHRLRGEILSDRGNATDALSDLDHVPGPPTPSASAARAVTLARLGRFAEAETGIEQALDAGRDNGPVLLRAAQIHALRGDPVSAARFARQAKNARGIPLTQHQRRQADGLQELGVTSGAS